MRRCFSVLAVVLLLAIPGAAGGADERTYGQLTVDNTSGGVALTAAVITPAGRPQMNHCLVRLETAEIRFTVDGTAPTTTVGTPMEALEVLTFASRPELVAYRAIRTTATSGTLNLNCWRE